MPRGVKYGGRTKGTPNKRTAEKIERAERVIQLLEEKYFDKDVAKISPAQRVALYSDMLEYVSPKLSRTELTGNVNSTIKITESE